MTVQLLPSDYDERIRDAVRRFWRARQVPGAGKQGGTRDAVIGGKTLDGFCELVRVVTVHCGLPADAVHTRRGGGTLPGYYRATKTWDALVIDRQRLVAAFEFKWMLRTIRRSPSLTVPHMPFAINSSRSD